jgi:predicted DNA-binding transcriptional regulator AlpA
MSDADEEEWLTISEAAKELGCSRTNIYQRIKTNAFAEAVVVKVSDCRVEWRISRRSFERWKTQRFENMRRGKRIEDEIRGTWLSAAG